MNNKSHSVFYCAIVVALGGFIFGLDAALISGTVRFVTAEFGLSDLQVGAVVSAPGFGVLFALLVTGYVCDHLGRKKTLLIISFIYILSAIASVLSTSYEALVAARFIGGLAFTSLSVSSMYIGEIAPPKLRGKLVSMIQINIVVGLSAAYFANYALLQLSQSDAAWVSALGIQENTWRWMLGVEIIPAIVWFALLFTIPQSPRWLVLKNQDDKAKAILARFEGVSDAEHELAQIKDSLSHNHIEQSFFTSFKGLFERRVRAAVIIGFTIAVIQQITGINAIMFYAPTVFEQLGVGTDTAFFNAVIVGLVSIVFTIVAILLIDRVGRRPLVIWGLATATISLFVCYWGFDNATYSLTTATIAELSTNHGIQGLEAVANQVFQSDVAFKQAMLSALGDTQLREFESVLLQHAADIQATLILIGIIGFIAAFHFSIGPIMWVLFSEIFPTHIRGVAIPTFAFVTSIVSYMVQQFFPWQLNNMGAADIFLFYAVCGVFGFVVLSYLMPETKNKTIEEIEELLAPNDDSIPVTAQSREA